VLVASAPRANCWQLVEPSCPHDHLHPRLQEKKDTAAREQADREHAEYLAALQAAERRKQQKQVRVLHARARGPCRPTA
jgi:hypothetical protein